MATPRQLPVIHQTGGTPAGAPAVVAPPPAASGSDWVATCCLIAATAVAGLLGIPLGLQLASWAAAGAMGRVPWAGLVQAHGQAQLYGWLGLAVLGVTLHALAHLFGAATPPARAGWTVLVLQVVGVLLRLAAPLTPGATAAPGAVLLLLSALAFLGAFAATLTAHVRTLPRRPREGRAPAVLPRFLLAGVLLWLAALLVNLDGAVDALRLGPPAAGAIAAGHDAFVVTASAAGLGLVALGMSLRVVVGWLDLPSPDLARAARAWWPLAAGAVLRVAGAVAGPGPTGDGLAALGALAWAAGVLWFVPALRGLWSRDAVTPAGGRRGEADPPLAWFVRAAYGWLLVGAALALAEAAATWAAASGALAGVPARGALADAGRHALLFGFLGTLTAGLTGRLPTAFLDLGDRGAAATRGAYRAAWVLLVPAAALRVGAPLAGDARAPLIALAGGLGSAALLCILVALATMTHLAVRPQRGEAGSPLPQPR